MKTKLLFAIAFLSINVAFGQLLIPNTTPVTQNFDTFGNIPAATLPTGFKVSTTANYTTGTTATGLSGGTTGAGALTTTSSGNIYNFGNGVNASSTDRALGFLTSGSFSSPRTIMLAIQNTNAGVMTDLTITFDYERYRTGISSLAMTFFHGATATAINTSASTGYQSYVSDTANNTVNPATTNSKSVTLTGLNIASMATYYLCWVYTGSASGNGQGVGIDNLSITAGFSVGCTTPVNQSSTIAIANITNQGADFSWVNAASATGTMVVIRPTAQANVLPAATGYTPNTSYTAAGQIDTNNRVIFRATGSSVTGITGLTPGTQYTATIYSYNDPGSCYNTTAPETLNFYTLSTEPTAHAATFSCTTISNTQINLNFSSATTVSASGYIILYKIGSAPTGLPTDGVFYPAGSVIGDATVLGQTALSSDTTFSGTALNGGTNYYFVLVPFSNNTGIADTYNYRTVVTIPSSNCATVTSPEINIKGVTGSNPSIPDGTTTTSGLNNTLYATVVVGSSQGKVFRIENTGNAPLTVSSITFVGGNSGDFAFSGISFPLIVGAGSFQDFTVTFSPTAAGTRTTTININNDDSNEGVYDFVLKGSGSISALVDINILGNGQSIPDNSLYPSGLNYTAFGVAIPYTSTVTRTFTIQNLGTTALSLTGIPIVTITGVYASMFSVTVQPSTNSIAGGSSLTFDVTFNPTSPGLKNATINILSNDPDEALYNFNINGTAKGANNVYVYGNANDVVKGTVTTSTTNNTNFGGVALTTGIKQNTFVITNLSASIIYISNLTISGADASMFTITNNASTDGLVSGNSTSFTINFTPTSVGTKNANITFNSWLNSGLTTPETMDPVYTFAISGLGINFISCAKGAVQTIAMQDFETIPSTPTWGYNAVASDATIYHTIGGGTAYGTSANQSKFINGSSFQFQPLAGTTGRYSTIFLDPLDVSSFSDVNLSLRVAPFSTSSGNGLDVNDYVSVEVSKDGGVNWTIETVLFGYSNSRYEFLSSGQKVFNTYYTGTNSGVTTNTKAVPSCTTGCLGTKTSSGTYAYSQINLNNLPNVSDLRVRIIAYCDNVSEIWAIDNIKLEGRVPVSTTWNGLAWSASAPTSSVKAIINGDYNVGLNGNIQTCECFINAGKTLNVDTGVLVTSNPYLEIQSNLTNKGTLNIENNGSLIQVNDGAVNIGDISMKRDALIKKSDYVYWSSPVLDFPVTNVSSGTPTNRIWKWNPTIANTNGGFGNWLNANENMAFGTGYIIRGPNGFNNSSSQTFTANFTGFPNNGIYDVSISRAGNTSPDYAGINGTTITKNDDNWNLIGNPYPSAIKALDFLNTNTSIQGVVHLWTHGTLPAIIPSPFYGTFQYNYDGNDYISYNASGTSSGPSVFNGFIGAGQSFFVVMNDGAAGSGTVTFNNLLRNKTNSNSQFYKNTNSSFFNDNIEKNRIWLDLVSATSGQVSRTLIGYIEGATQGNDRMFDASTNYQNSQNLFSIIGDEIMDIQGRSLPFSSDDLVPIGVIIPANGNFSIAIAFVDGLFSNGAQTIYLEDKLLNIIHNLSVSPYSFTASEGVNKNRFVLRYSNNSLTTNAFQNIIENVIIEVQNKNIGIKSNLEKIKDLMVYDLQGRKISEMHDINKNEVFFDKSLISNQTLVIKIILQNGEVVTKKVVI